MCVCQCVNVCRKPNGRAEGRKKMEDAIYKDLINLVIMIGALASFSELHSALLEAGIIGFFPTNRTYGLIPAAPSLMSFRGPVLTRCFSSQDVTSRNTSPARFIGESP